MIINKTNELKIIDTINKIQKGARERLISIDNVYDSIKEIESKLSEISKNALDGSIFSINIHAQHFANSYNSSPKSTQFNLLYKNRSWRIEDIARSCCGDGKIRCRLSDTAKEYILNQYRFI